MGAALTAAGPVAEAQSQLVSLSGDSFASLTGEQLSYSVRVARFGKVGEGSMWVEGPQTFRGDTVYLLQSSFNSRVGLFRARNHSRSWFDAVRMTSLRFEKEERQPLSSHREAVDLYPQESRWVSADGTSGESLTSDPLDELSFIYFVRTLPLVVGESYSFDRHFDPTRNPVTIEVTGRDTITTGAGSFPTLSVVMRVRDPARYRGEGVIRFELTDDPCRLPVRIESSVPIVGTAVITLESHSHSPAVCVPLEP